MLNSKLLNKALADRDTLINETDNFAFEAKSKQQEESKTPIVINVQQNNEDMTVVETDHKNKKFLFYDKSRNFLGSFDVKEYVKYVTFNVTTEFLQGTDETTSKFVIEKYICKRNDNDKTLVMLNYFESPFMGNIETLIKFYNFLYDYEQTSFRTDLQHLKQKDADDIVLAFNKSTYALMSHMLRIIASIATKLTSEDTKIRDSVLRYSVAVVYRLSKLVKDDIDKRISEIDSMKKRLVELETNKKQIVDKIDAFQRTIEKQNNYIDIIFRHALTKNQTPILSSPSSGSSSSSETEPITENASSNPESLAEIISLHSSHSNPSASDKTGSHLSTVDFGSDSTDIKSDKSANILIIE